ncbi:MAG: helix-turn-helix domain-containing protein [Pseudonocardiaceae bacterium]
MRACEQIENGARAEDVAASLGFNRSTVFGWIAAYRNGGAEALRAKPVPGRPPKLTLVQMDRTRSCRHPVMTAADCQRRRSRGDTPTLHPGLQGSGR